jgi:cytidyltransferase-like protein
LFTTQEERIMLSGGFDPLHVGHLRMIQEAAKYGRVIIALNSDDWLIRNKKYSFMTWEDRAEILMGLRDVWRVISFDDSDETACDAIIKEKPTVFGNGGDRTSSNTPEVSLCQDMGIRLVWNLGGDKVRSSALLLRRAGC